MSDDELRDQLRLVDPVAGGETLSSAETEGLLEATMASDPSDAETIWSSHRWALALVAASIVAIGVVGAVFVGGDDLGLEATDRSSTAASPRPVPTPSPVSTPAPTPASTGAATTELLAPAAVNARCAVPTPQLLANATSAFDGVVDNIAADQVTLEVSKVYAGDVANEVIVTATPTSIADLISATEFTEGERYLVSAVDGQLTVCGFSGPYSTDLEQLYVAAFGR